MAVKKKKNLKKKTVKQLRETSKAKKKASSTSTLRKESKKKTSTSKTVKKSTKSSTKKPSSKKSLKTALTKKKKTKKTKKTKPISSPIKKIVNKETVKTEKVLKTNLKQPANLDKNQIKAPKAKSTNVVSSLTPKKAAAKVRMKKRKILELQRELEYLSKRDQSEVLLKDAEGRSYCQDEHCDQPAVTDMYCRYHYLALWKYLQTKKQLSENRYLFHTIQDIMKALGEEALQFVLRDLKNEKTFESVTKEMNFSIKKDDEMINIESDTGF